ncbi:hypothetical protein NEOKW01_1731 [Nematocida sp. AWRm80]|nr:hypothetical protein NEOKW01_1731 [Nematocida sp. AWRm80]
MDEEKHNRESKEEKGPEAPLAEKTEREEPQESITEKDSKTSPIKTDEKQSVPDTARAETKKMSLSDAFLKGTIYTKKPSHYTNILVNSQMQNRQSTQEYSMQRTIYPQIKLGVQENKGLIGGSRPEPGSDPTTLRAPKMGTQPQYYSSEYLSRRDAHSTISNTLSRNTAGNIMANTMNTSMYSKTNSPEEKERNMPGVLERYGNSSHVPRESIVGNMPPTLAGDTFDGASNSPMGNTAVSSNTQNSLRWGDRIPYANSSELSTQKMYRNNSTNSTVYGSPSHIPSMGPNTDPRSASSGYQNAMSRVGKTLDNLAHSTRDGRQIRQISGSESTPPGHGYTSIGSPQSIPSRPASAPSMPGMSSQREPLDNLSRYGSMCNTTQPPNTSSTGIQTNTNASTNGIYANPNVSSFGYCGTPLSSTSLPNSMSYRRPGAGVRPTVMNGQRDYSVSGSQNNSYSNMRYNTSMAGYPLTNCTIKNTQIISETSATAGSTGPTGINTQNSFNTRSQSSASMEYAATGQATHSSLYNPLTCPMYDASAYSQLKLSKVSANTLISILKPIKDPMEVHMRLNELLGLPRIHTHHINMTRTILSIIETWGGLKEVDEKTLWGQVAKEIGYMPDDYQRLRIYYLVICYPYEQLRQAKKASVQTANGQTPTPKPILVIHIDTKKADLFPSFIHSQIAKKKTNRKQSYIRLTEKSMPLEIVCTLNHIYTTTVSTLSDLQYIIKFLSSVSCTTGSISIIYTCKEISFIHAQLQAVMRKWITRHIKESKSKNIKHEMEIVCVYQHYLALLLQKNYSLETSSVRDSVMCSECKSVCTDNTKEQFYLSMLDFLSKSSALVVTKSTATLLISVIRGAKDQLGFKDQYIRKVLIIIWNIFRYTRDPEITVYAKELIDQKTFAAVSESVTQFIYTPIISKQDILQIISGGELEIIMRIYIQKNGPLLLPEITNKRFAQLWRCLLALFLNNTFSIASLSYLLPTAKSALDILSTYLYSILIGSGSERESILKVLDAEENHWGNSIFLVNSLPQSVYNLYTQIFSVPIENLSLSSQYSLSTHSPYNIAEDAKLSSDP